MRRARRTVRPVSAAPAVDAEITMSALIDPAEGASSPDHSTEPRLPHAKTAAAKSTRFHPICFMEVSRFGRRPRSSRPGSLIQINHPERRDAASMCTEDGKHAEAINRPSARQGRTWPCVRQASAWLRCQVMRGCILNSALDWCTTTKAPCSARPAMQAATMMSGQPVPVPKTPPPPATPPVAENIVADANPGRAQMASPHRNAEAGRTTRSLRRAPRGRPRHREGARQRSVQRMPDDHADHPQPKAASRSPGQRCRRTITQRHADDEEADRIVRGVAEKMERVGLQRAEPTAEPSPISTRNMAALIASTAQRTRR